MRLKVTLAIIASMAVCSQSFGFDLLDRMLGGSGCASSCCETAASCGCDNVGSGCASANMGCAGSGGCGLLNGCRHKLLTFEQKCVSIRVPKINLPEIKMPKLGCCDPCKAGCCDSGCAAGNGCCAADPSCGCDNGCGLLKGCCKKAAPSCGCDNGCGAGNGCCEKAAPSCGCDNACAPACCKPGLLDRIRARMACHKACRCASAPAGCCETAAPSCGCDNGCSAGAACGCDAYTAPAAAPAAQPVPPQPVVDPAAFNTRSNRIIQASLSDR